MKEGKTVEQLSLTGEDPIAGGRPIYGGFPPHEPTDQGGTSKAAAASIVPTVAGKRRRVLQVIAAAPGGLTCQEVEHRTGWMHQTVSARIRELSLAGRVHYQGRRPNPVGGRSARVYFAGPGENR